ncbi:hypothetical protein [Lactobacillus amylovorus]|uniref:hypothetical protein n=1 Tax=Lactobacillus amylovorus TaxID=1604 RepID=UPI00232EA934|nr:hypothetical protein [Lactobacillus amylovorus]MDB6234505.1 hypothetical protein [Lactobacillus amylovorus]
MFNKENAIDASKLHVDSFKYQSTEDMPNEIYEEWQEKHMNAKLFSLQFHNIGQSAEWQEMIIIWADKL